MITQAHLTGNISNHLEKWKKIVYVEEGKAFLEKKHAYKEVSTICKGWASINCL